VLSRVLLHVVAATLWFDPSVDLCASGPARRLGSLHPVHDLLAVFDHVDDVKFVEGSHVAGLTAAVGVEACAIEDYGHVFALVGCRDHDPSELRVSVVQ